MRLASVLTPLNEYHLALAAQCGVEDIVVRYPGPHPDELLQLQRQIEAHGLRIGAVEGYLPMEQLKFGLPGRERDREAMTALIRQMGRAGVPVLSYHFMPSTDWVRTSVDAPERGGARVTAFDLAAADRAVSLVAPGASELSPRISADELWNHLESFLRELVPVAEDAGVFLAMHPDDPPVPTLRGRAGIMNSVRSMEQLVQLAPSEHSGICFCQGTFAAMGVDIPATIRRLGRHIRYVHFRDVRGTPERFVETFHDNGPTDMVAAMAAYREIGFQGPMRPDHVPMLAGEEGGEPGYTMMGRLFAYGYMRGLIQAVGKR
jgi:mannonate dehydratase